jgi:RHS repeat-associated protein
LHYYPFGLVMSGISSKSAGSLENKYKFGGKELQSDEFSDNSGLELYDFSARMYDQQTGHFPNPDPLAEQFSSWSPYVYSYNNPIRFGDPTGMSSYDWVQTTDGQMKWDDRVIDDASAVKYYGEGSTYRAPGYSYTSGIGAVTLGDNQQYTLNGASKTAVNSTPGLGDRIGFEIINWFSTTDFVVEGKAKVSAGAQIGISGNAFGVQGKLEAGAQTFDLAEASYDITEMSGHAGASPQRVHNFIGAEGKFFSDRLRVGGKYDYTYEYYNSYYGPKMEDGTATHDWSVSLPFKNFGPKIKLADNMISTQMKASANGQSTNGKSFYGVDVGASLKVILGVELKLKIGFNR